MRVLHFLAIFYLYAYILETLVLNQHVLRTFRQSMPSHSTTMRYLRALNLIQMRYSPGRLALLQGKIREKLNFGIVVSLTSSNNILVPKVPCDIALSDSPRGQNVWSKTVFRKYLVKNGIGTFSMLFKGVRGIFPNFSLLGSLIDLTFLDYLRTTTI